MSIFTEDECANILEEIISISAYDALAILKAPQKMKLQLHDLYYTLLQKLCPHLSQSLAHLGDLPPLDVGSSLPPHSSASISLPRLAVLLTKKLRELHPDYPVAFGDLARPKKSRTLEIVSFLLNAAIFDQANRSARDLGLSKIRKLKELNKGISQKQNFDKDTADKNQRTINKLNDDVKEGQARKKDREASVRELCNEYHTADDVAEQICQSTRVIDEKLQDCAKHIDEHLSKKVEELKLQLLDPNLDENRETASRDAAELMVENAINKKRHKNWIKMVDCYRSYEGHVTTASSLVTLSNEFSTQNEEKFAATCTNEKEREKAENELDETRRKIGRVKQMERKAEKEDVVFKIKQLKADQLTNDLVTSAKGAERELTRNVESLGERHTLWLKVKSECEDLRKEGETANSIEENVFVFLDEYKTFRGSLEEPCRILGNAVMEKKQQLEQISHISNVKFPGISELLDATVKGIYTNVIKPHSGKDHFDGASIEKIANVIQLLITKFDFIKEEFKMSRVIDTTSITTKVGQVLSDIGTTESQDETHFMPILKTSLKALNCKLEKIHVDSYSSAKLVPEVSVVKKFPDVEAGCGEFNNILTSIAKLEDQYTALRRVGDVAKQETARRSATLFALDWINAVLETFEDVLLRGSEKYGLKSKNVLWDYAQEFCIEQLKQRDLQLREELEQMRTERVARLLEQKIAEEKKKIVKEKAIAEQKRLKERKRIEEKILEERRLAEERKLEEERRLEEEKRLEEERKLEEERQFEEEKRLEEEKRIEEERLAEEEQKKVEENKLEEEKGIEVQQGVDEVTEKVDKDTVTPPITGEEGYEARKRKLRRQTYNVAKPAKIRRLLDQEVEQSDKNKTYTKETNNKTFIITKEAVSKAGALSADSEISFNTPVKSSSTMIAGKSDYAAGRRKTYTVPTPIDVNFIRNSTRRSSVVFTPELLKSAMRPSNILPHPPTPEVEKILLKYSSRVTADTPRRRSKPRLSSAPSTPMCRLVLDKLGLKCPRTETPKSKSMFRTPQISRMNVTARSHPSIYSEDQFNMTFNSKVTLDAFDFSATSEEDCRSVSNLYTPCAPRMAAARSLVTPVTSEKLDFSDSAKKSDVGQSPATESPMQFEQPDFSEDEISICLNKTETEINMSRHYIEVDKTDESGINENDDRLEEELTNEEEEEEAVQTDEDRMSVEEETQTDPIKQDVGCSAEMSQELLADKCDYHEQHTRDVACGITMIEDRLEKSVACGTSFFDERHNKSVACGRTIIEESEVEAQNSPIAQEKTVLLAVHSQAVSYPARQIKPIMLSDSKLEAEVPTNTADSDRDESLAELPNASPDSHVHSTCDEGGTIPEVEHERAPEPRNDVTSEPLNDVTSEPLNDITSEPLNDVTSEPHNDVTSEMDVPEKTVEVEKSDSPKEKTVISKPEKLGKEKSKIKTQIIKGPIIRHYNLSATVCWEIRFELSRKGEN